MCVCVYMYIYNYFILIINDSLNKRFCKKIFGFNISLFKKCYVYNIFTINFHNIINWHYSNIFYSFNIFIDTLPHTQPNPFPFSFSLSFFFFFSSHFSLAKSQPYTFCKAPAQFKSLKKILYIYIFFFFLRSHTCDPTYPTPLNHTSHKNPHSLGPPLICFFPPFIFFFISYHSLISFHGHSITSTIIFRQGPQENSIEKKGKAHSSLKEFISNGKDSSIIFCVCHFTEKLLKGNLVTKPITQW